MERRNNSILFWIVIAVSVIFLLICFYDLSLAEETSKEERYVKNGVVIIDGHLTKVERTDANREYETRMIKIEEQRNEEIARKHQLECIKEFAKIEALREEASKNELQALMLSGQGQNINIAEGGKAEANSLSVSEANASCGGGGSGVVPTINNTLVNVSENNNTVKSTNTQKQ